MYEEQIKVITFFDKHSTNNVPNISSTNEKQNDKDTLNDIAAAVAIAIYKKTKSKITKNIPIHISDE